MNKTIQLLIMLSVLLFISCHDEGSFDSESPLVGIWASFDYTVISVGANNKCKLYILPDKTFYFLYYTDLVDTVPLNNVSVKGVIINDVDVSDYPPGGMFLQFDITHEFNGSAFVPVALPDLNVYIDELGTTRLRFHNDVDYDFITQEPNDEMGHFMRLIE